MITEKTRERLRKSHLGKTPWNKGVPNPAMRGENNPAKRPEVRKKISDVMKIIKIGNKNNYKGENAILNYQYLHGLIRKQFGTPRLCEHCNKTDKKAYDWANKSGKYIRKRVEWLRLCRKCHITYDKKRGIKFGRKPKP